MDVASWLRNLGLERYEAAFRENDVGADLLCQLTADDLKELGVAAVGHRRRLLAAIAGLREDAVEPSVVGQASQDHPPASAAERRHITVLFCDIVGSTATLGPAGSGRAARSADCIPGGRSARGSWQAGLYCPFRRRRGAGLFWLAERGRGACR